ncbi:hypothetical protein SSX86_029465 [Deinandra increscens subsp. villosa]|uniref:RBR-type E3 ubiquitin transferase n=1 Tax=Deinandra increscens subsp. villosa TaxID=3103831 RepID=A0AAP0CF42_9ASTR
MKWIHSVFSRNSKKMGVKMQIKGKSEFVIVEEKELSGGFDANKDDDEDDGDVMTRLEKLRLIGEEPDLSEELIKDNDQLQEDEVLAMESIYGENIFILDNHNGLRSFQIHIYIETPEELTISTKLNSSQDLNTYTNNSEGFSYSFEVKYIPPIILTCVLPKSYPTHLPPYFTISVQWLDSLKISSLCSMLDSIWKEQHGQEVIYSWAEWLHSSTISYLGFNEEIILGPYGVKHQGDPRAFSGCVSPDVDVPSLKSYNEEQRLENFLKTLQECCICFSEFAGAEFIRLPCQHFFCEKCMKTYAEVLIEDGTVNKLSCPTTKCGGMIPPGLLKRLLGDEEFEKWESLTLQKTLESMSDVVYCPRCETPCIEDEDQDAQCSKCFFSFCTLCREKRHVGIMCITPEMKLRILQERQTSTQMKDKQRQREREMIEELLSVKEILRDAKQCPSCKMAISKTEGCNKMVCENCGNYFCYRCNKVIDGYDHYRDGACELFPQEEIQHWEEQMNPRQVIGRQMQDELMLGDRGHSCPQCRQINLKVGNNNHIFCWACQGHYCYLCGKMVKRGSQHFGPKGCKQHTQPSTSSAARHFSDIIPKSSRNSRWASRNQRMKSYEVASLKFNPKQEEVDDVVLEKSRLFGEEPDLSEDLIRHNDQLQQDEVLAMESIYGENMFILDNYKGLRSFQIHIYIETPEELTISTKLKTDNRSDSEGFSYSFEVKYTPPILLTCVLPKSYPTHLPPYFTISVQWLDSLRISSLCSMLDSIWKEQHGQEVIYSWAEWLHSSTIPYLGFNEEITLGPYVVQRQGDPRALSGSVSPEVDVPSLKSYNEEQRHENFLKTLQECCICFGEFVGAQFIRLPCQHFFCEKCMKTYAEILIQDGTVNKLSCPTAKCGGMIPPSLLKRLLGDEEFEKWESLTLQKALESMFDVVYCPRCETPCLEDEDQDAQCTKCFYSFCTLCREKRHVGVMCITAEMKLRLLQERQASTQMKDKQRQREREMIEELLIVKEILHDAKQCPSCKMAISKTEEEIQNWEEDMNLQQEDEEILDDELLYDHRHSSCPQCGQINFKVENNNHIFCWACEGHYCYLCGKMVKRSSQHYGPKGCKQHTVG